MYYSDEILEEVRSRSDIVDVIGSYVKLKRSGGTYFGLCPFHNEKTPSFSVTPRKQMFYCFGCHKGGSVITFVELYENYSFQEAVRFLADRAGVELPAEEESPQQKQAQDLRMQLLNVNKLAGTYYYYNLRGEAGKQGMNYLRGRGLSDDVMQRFGLGYAGKYSDGLYRYLKKQNISDELLKKSGLMNVDEKKGMYDKFWNRVMFPIMDVNNRIIGFGGRVMGEGKPKYLNSPENELFNKRRNLYGLQIARRSREKVLILCEGYMDVIALHQAGFDNAVASLGTALTEEHAALLSRYTQQVLLSYDSDSAGVDAALRAIPMLRSSGIDVRVLSLSPYKDPDELIRAEGTGSYRQRMEQAQNSFLFEVSVLKSRHDMDDPDSKTRFQQKVAAMIAQYELEAQRENYIEAASGLCGIGFDALRQMVNRYLTGGVPVKAPPRSLQDNKFRKNRDEGILASQRLLLGTLANYPSFYPVLKKYVSPQDYEDPVYRQAAEILYEQLENGWINEAAVIDSFTDPEQQTAAAGLFQMQMDFQSEQDLVKAMRETLLKVTDYSFARDISKEGNEEPGLNQVARMIERKRLIEKIRSEAIELTKDPDSGEN